MKNKGFSSRNKVLDKELKTLKVGFEHDKQVFIDKSQNDDKYVNALKDEVNRLKDMYEKLKNQPPETITRVVYKVKDEFHD